MQLFKKLHVTFCNFMEYNYWLSFYPRQNSHKQHVLYTIFIK